MRKILMLLLLSAPALSAGAEEPALEEAQPGAGHIMIEMGYRYSVLYFAATQQRWEFAAYQLEEMEEALQRLAFLQPKLWEDIGRFRATAIRDLEKVLAAKNDESFSASFEKFRAACTACHARNGVGFIRLPVPKGHASPVLD
jgi:hypothetical protein